MAIPIGLVIAALVVLLFFAFIALVVLKTMSRSKSDRAFLAALGLQVTSETPLVASGTVAGRAVTFEEHNYRSGTTRGVAPMIRIRVSPRPRGRLPETALIDRNWNVIGATRPNAPVLPTGVPGLDARFEAYGNDPGFWRRAMSSPVLAECILNVGRGRLREVTVFGGQVTLVADSFAEAGRRRRIVEAAVSLAGMG